MTMTTARAFRVSDASRPILQCFIKEPIPPTTKFVLASSEGYLFFDQDPAPTTERGTFRIPQFAMLSYYEIQYESD